MKRPWLLGLFTLTSTLLCANDSYDYGSKHKYYDENERGTTILEEDQHWQGSVDWIFWNTRSCDLDYLISWTDEDDLVPGRVYNLEPEYDHGVRLKLGKNWDDKGFFAHYTFYQSNIKNTGPEGEFAGTHFIPQFTIGIEQGNLYPTVAQLDLCFHELDALCYHLCDCSSAEMELELFAGPKILSFDQLFKINYANPDLTYVDIVRSDLAFKAIGLTVGSQTRYELCSGFDLFGSLSLDFFAADIRRYYKYSASADGDFETRVDLKEDCWSALGKLNLICGLSYQLERKVVGMRPYLALGYEFHHWINPANFLILDTNNNGDSTRADIQDYKATQGFDGLFVRFGGSF